MSANRVSKVLIDYLLTAAVKWGRDGHPVSYYWAVSGRRAVGETEADRVGAMLWQANRDQTEGPRGPGKRRIENGAAYGFEPVPGIPEPVAVLKQISYYRYQTVGEDVDSWKVSEPATFLDALEGVAISRLPRYSDVPWGVDDLRELRGWVEPDVDTPDPTDLRNDPAWAEVRARLHATGLPFAPLDRRTASVRRPGTIRSEEVPAEAWEVRLPRGNFPTATVKLFESEEVATWAYDMRLSHMRADRTNPNPDVDIP